jgi:hypothetical protein
MEIRFHRVKKSEWAKTPRQNASEKSCEDKLKLTGIMIGLYFKYLIL